MSFKVSSRDAGRVIILDLEGRITIGDGSEALRDLVRERLNSGQTKILLNFAGIAYMDSSGLGELVSGLRAVQAKGGELKLMNLTKKINDLLRITKLYSVFDIHTDEAGAVASFKV
jgi:anti-sigma B factor antagonist